MRGFRTVVGLGAVWLSAAACSSSTGSASSQQAGKDAGASGAPTSAGAGGASSGGAMAAPSTSAGGVFTGIDTNPVILDGGSCAQSVTKGEAVPLDMYILLDKSASMTEMTGTGATKWDAIGSALESFVNDPASAGLGVGLQYFPILKPGVPATCTSHAQCGSGGPCFLSACTNPGANGEVVICASNSDCGRGGQCQNFGVCQYYPTGGDPEICAPIGGTCSGGLGACQDVPDRWCVNGTECTNDAYASPAVPIAALPGNAKPLMTSIDGTTPEGRTPTAPALGGAIDEATTWSKTNPGHRVIAVLATDGLPTECTPTDITAVSGIASAGVAATPSISTFVIGVFGPDDTDSQTNLDTIAQAGGTTKAFIVDTSGDVTKQFQTALNAIRGSSLVSCDFQVPPSTGSAGLDFGKVNLEVTSSNGQKEQLVYVDNDSACGSTNSDAWHYDVDPATSTPQRIIVCPSACTKIQADVGAVVNLQIGCKATIR